LGLLLEGMCCDNHGLPIKEAEQSVDICIVSDANFPKVLRVDHFAEQVAGGELGSTDVFEGNCDLVLFRSGEFAQELDNRTGSAL